MSSTVIWSKSKPEVEFEYGESCFSQPEVVVSHPWIKIMSMNFYMRIDVDLQKRVTSSNMKRK